MLCVHRLSLYYPRLRAVNVPQGTIYGLDVDPTNNYIVTAGQVSPPVLPPLRTTSGHQQIAGVIHRNVESTALDSAVAARISQYAYFL